MDKARKRALKLYSILHTIFPDFVEMDKARKRALKQNCGYNNKEPSNKVEMIEARKTVLKHRQVNE